MNICNCSAGLRIYIANKVRFADREKEQWQQAQIHLHNELVRIAIFAWICACNYEGTEQLQNVYDDALETADLFEVLDTKEVCD